MPWFKSAVGGVVVLGLVLALFFAPVVARPVDEALRAGGPAAVWLFTLARFALLYGAAFGLAFAAARGHERNHGVGLLVAGPAALVGGLLGVMAALEPWHVAFSLAAAAGLVGVALWGARWGAAS